MTTTFSIKSVLAVSLVFILSAISSTAGALVSSTTVSGCSLYKKALGQCTVFTDTILKGLGNVTRNPTAFTATMSKISGSIFCKNPAGNTVEDNNGTPFTEVAVVLAGADTINPAQVTKNGKALSEIDFHDQEIIAAIKSVPGISVPDCQNSNWIQVIVVTKMQIMGQQWEDPSPGDNASCFLTPGPGENFDFADCNNTDTLRVSCRIQDPYFSNPASAIGVKLYNYGADVEGPGAGTGSCTVICHSTNPAECNLTSP